ncbi:hypothetical protein L9Z17_21070 [Leptospira noguchii]|nr:hypothetical protein [Leptospira noguchii]
MKDWNTIPTYQAFNTTVFGESVYEPLKASTGIQFLKKVPKIESFEYKNFTKGSETFQLKHRNRRSQVIAESEIIFCN